MGGVHNMVCLVLFEQLDSVLDRLRLILKKLFTIIAMLISSMVFSQNRLCVTVLASSKMKDGMYTIH